MSVQFGICNFDGKLVDPQDLDQVRPIVAPYGPDGEGYFCEKNIGILYRAFHTTKESRKEMQPYVSSSGAVITWEGRLDNREELIGELDGELSCGSTDLEIVGTAYTRWGTNSFAKLIGDWALSIWNPNDHSLVLATDFVGMRHLHYSIDKDQVTWSTILDPLVLFAGRSFAIEEEYIAGWLSRSPATHLTPYVGVRSVPASFFVHLEKGRQRLTKYWDFDPTKRIKYCTDAEYEEHFRAVFADSCRRRLRSDAPLLAELSGGMDSSSIVCVADLVIARGEAETSGLDTVSYYDDSEPNWNERPFFTIVEEQRGKTGCHIDLGSVQDSWAFQSDGFAVAPGSIDCSRPSAGRLTLIEYMTTHKNRVVLSGTGGDEVMGGVPTSLPELQDLLARTRFRELAHQLKVWALSRRKPWVHLLLEAALGFCPSFIVGPARQKSPIRWLDQSFSRRNRAALSGYESRLKLFGALPSFQDNLNALDGLRRQIACCLLPSHPLCEVRHPYLDRSLLEFIYAIPREQLVRPGQRRSLMRRALVDIVPDKVLNRRQKAFVTRGPMRAISTQWGSLSAVTQHMTSESLGLVDQRSFVETLQKICQGQEGQVVPVMRMLAIEFWLQELAKRGLWSPPSSFQPRERNWRNTCNLPRRENPDTVFRF